jgi:hypothetical protein
MTNVTLDPPATGGLMLEVMSIVSDHSRGARDSLRRDQLERELRRTYPYSWRDRLELEIIRDHRVSDDEVTR